MFTHVSTTGICAQTPASLSLGHGTAAALQTLG